MKKQDFKDIIKKLPINPAAVNNRQVLRSDVPKTDNVTRDHQSYLTGSINPVVVNDILGHRLEMPKTNNVTCDHQSYLNSEDHIYRSSIIVAIFYHWGSDKEVTTPPGYFIINITFYP